MTEDEARARIAGIVPHAMLKLERYADLLLRENARQNLVARSTEPTIWSRHFLDAIQLIAFARTSDRSWLDIGSGPGLPGLVLAIAGDWQVTLVEPRRRRAQFLQSVVADLHLATAAVRMMTGEQVADRHDLVSARAVASVDALFAMTRRCTDPDSRFILPKGQSAWSDVDAAKRRWHGVFHVEQSITDPAAGIVIADRVTRR